MTTTTTKNVNYTAEQTAELLVLYAEGVSTAEIAATFGKGVKSIVAKLSREGVYQKKEYVSKTGAKPVSKEQHVAAIAAFLGVPAEKMESLEKANKNVLQLLEDFVKQSAQDFDSKS